MASVATADATREDRQPLDLEGRSATADQDDGVDGMGAVPLKDGGEEEEYFGTVLHEVHRQAGLTIILHHSRRHVVQCGLLAVHHRDNEARKSANCSSNFDHGGSTGPRPNWQWEHRRVRRKTCGYY